MCVAALRARFTLTYHYSRTAGTHGKLTSHATVCVTVRTTPRMTASGQISSAFTFKSPAVPLRHSLRPAAQLGPIPRVACLLPSLVRSGSVHDCGPARHVHRAQRAGPDGAVHAPADLPSKPGRGRAAERNITLGMLVFDLQARGSFCPLSGPHLSTVVPQATGVLAWSRAPYLPLPPRAPARSKPARRTRGKTVRGRDRSTRVMHKNSWSAGHGGTTRALVLPTQPLGRTPRGSHCLFNLL